MLNSVIGSSMTFAAFIICEFTAVVLGLLTALVFSFKSRHSSSLMVSLAVLPAVVTLVIMLVNGNIGAGLAVAGTFALVRFRSTPGSAKEITGLFFAVAIGLACGMGYVGIAVIFFACIGLYVWVLSVLHFGEAASNKRRLKITIPENLDFEGIFDDLFETYTVAHELVKVKTTNMGTLYELTYEIVLKNNCSVKAFIDDLRCRNGNLNIVCGREMDGEVL